MNTNLMINLTPHVVRLNSGEEFPPSGQVARVSTRYGEFDERGVCSAAFGEVTGLPAPNGALFIVSAIVAAAVDRSDVVSPATGHPDAVRKDGQVWSVPGFVLVGGGT